MSDDWLNKSGRDKPGKSPAPDEQPIALDSMGIPILEEVVFVEEDYSFDTEITFNSIPEPSVKPLTEKDESNLNSTFELPEDPKLLEEHFSKLAQESKIEPDSSLERATKKNTAAAPETATTDQSPPDTGIQYELLREQLRSQIKQDLEAIAGGIAKAVVEKLSTNLEQQIQSELRHSLDHHLDQMIDQAINDISEHKENH